MHFLWCVLMLICLVSTSTLVASSWVESANDPESDFPIENLPFGVFSCEDRHRHIGVAIGDRVLDVTRCAQLALLPLSDDLLDALCTPSLNALMAMGGGAWHELRQALQQILSSERNYEASFRDHLVLPMKLVTMHLPADIGDYTDFYTSLDHASNASRLLRPENPSLTPNFKHMPLGYHGRTSSIVVSGASIRRPSGQVRSDDAKPEYGPTEKLDYEMELGVFMGPGNPQGLPIAIEEAHKRLFGVVILNDWSARDVQKWECLPLGPLNAKNFATSISPWVVTMAALEPYRLSGPQRADSDPAPLPYLRPVGDFCYDITVEVYICSQAMRERGIAPARISRGNFSSNYWTFPQMLTQHTSTGCNMRPGDLIGSGTISGSTRDSRGCMLEYMLPDGSPIALPDGTTRHFLIDGDEVVMKAYAHQEGLPRIGFGECRGIVLPAHRASSLADLKVGQEVHQVVMDLGTDM